MRCDVRIRSQKAACNGKAEPEEPQRGPSSSPRRPRPFPARGASSLPPEWNALHLATCSQQKCTLLCDAVFLADIKICYLMLIVCCELARDLVSKTRNRAFGHFFLFALKKLSPKMLRCLHSSMLTMILFVQFISMVVIKSWIESCMKNDTGCEFLRWRPKQLLKY